MALGLPAGASDGLPAGAADGLDRVGADGLAVAAGEHAASAAMSARNTTVFLIMDSSSGTGGMSVCRQDRRSGRGQPGAAAETDPTKPPATRAPRAGRDPLQPRNRRPDRSRDLHRV